VPNTEFDPLFPGVDVLFSDAPPAPTVTVYVVPTLTLNTDSALAPPPLVEPITDDLNPPAPPPPAYGEPPLAPPATTKYSINKTGAQDIVPELLNWYIL
jgi:hypothetical protein